MVALMWCSGNVLSHRLTRGKGTNMVTTAQ